MPTHHLSTPGATCKTAWRLHRVTGELNFNKEWTRLSRLSINLRLPHLEVRASQGQLTAPPDVKRDIALVARCMEAGTLVMSAGLNALAFTGGAFDAAHWAQVAFGCFVPAAISGAHVHPSAAHAAFSASGGVQPLATVIRRSLSAGELRSLSVNSRASGSVADGIAVNAISR
jgi:hypothetical protein